MLPRKWGPVSSTTPLPICVVIAGMPSFSMNWRSILLVSLRLAPAPTTMSGLRAFRIASTPRQMALSSAIGRRVRLGSSTGMEECSRAMSSGSSRWVAPGRSSWARRNASRMRAGMVSPLTTVLVNLVSGRIISTTSMIWNWPCLLDLIGFWPVIMTIGMAPSWA